jgi:murein DD-endopeptidase MepM/ murein hydrolase activator NlpD
MQRIVFSLLFFLSFLIRAQESYPQDSFRSPLDIPLILAGNFGELRSNHFHSGIDIKTQQREGLPVYAIGDGAITRIKVAVSGYGKVMYLTHPNGYTSVYGHLQKFAPEIEAYIKKIQYEKKIYEVEELPNLGELTVKKGDLIAYTGNTGGSSGPHLHFEIRQTVSERATNPLLHGLAIADNTNPTLIDLYGYPLSAEAQINQRNERVQLKFTKQADGTFLADKVQALGTIGFGFNGFDRQDMAANQNGIFSVQQIVNGTVVTAYDFDSFSFEETRYINTLIDYPYYTTYRRHIQKCFKHPDNKLTIYTTLVNDGKIVVEEGLTYQVELILSDLEGNVTKVVIPIEGKQAPLKIEKKQEITENYIIAKKPNNFDLGIAQVYFPANTFYEDFFIDLQKEDDIVTIHHGAVPAHHNFTITFDVEKYTEEERKQLFIARLDQRKRPYYNNTFKRGTTFTTRTRFLGMYALAKDSIPPKIRPKNYKEKQWLNNYRYLSLVITDELSGIDTYSATLNGNWILMEYEPKTSTLTYNFDDMVLDNTQCELILTVTDNVGNTNTCTSTFYRK